MKRSIILLICISTWGCVKKEPSFTALNGTIKYFV